MRIRLATSDDISLMMDLERACPAAAHWTGGQYRRAFEKEEGDAEGLVLLAEETGSQLSGILGFLVARRIAHEWELENIVVAPEARRTGIGRQLLAGLLTRARETGSESVSLEVRESNLDARSFYEKNGFRRAGRRPMYYNSPQENAILYQLGLNRVPRAGSGG